MATHVTFPMWTVRGKAISEFRSPNALPRAPTPLGTELVLHLRCVTLLTFVCMLRYSMWNVVPRMFLTSHYSDRIVLCQYHLTPTLLPITQDRTQSRPHPSFTELTTSRGAGVHSLKQKRRHKKATSFHKPHSIPPRKLPKQLYITLLHLYIRCQLLPFRAYISHFQDTALTKPTP